MEHGPLIILRHPQWKAADPYQDIPIYVFTRSQWEGAGQGPPAVHAGGVDFEFAHNGKFVFSIYSRFNLDESVKGHREAGLIVERNLTAHGPRLREY